MEEYSYQYYFDILVQSNKQKIDFIKHELSKKYDNFPIYIIQQLKKYYPFINENEYIVLFNLIYEHNIHPLIFKSISYVLIQLSCIQELKINENLKNNTDFIESIIHITSNVNIMFTNFDQIFLLAEQHFENNEYLNSYNKLNNLSNTELNKLYMNICFNKVNINKSDIVIIFIKHLQDLIIDNEQIKSDVTINDFIEFKNNYLYSIKEYYNIEKQRINDFDIQNIEEFVLKDCIYKWILLLQENINKNYHKLFLNN